MKYDGKCKSTGYKEVTEDERKKSNIGVKSDLQAEQIVRYWKFQRKNGGNGKQAN